MYNKIQINYTHNGIIHSRNIAYTSWGDYGKPTILCVHALTRNARDFDFLAQALSKDYYVLCIDIVGRGRSDFAEDSSHYNYETYINDIKHFLDALNIKKVTWIGSSMGGLIGMIFSTLYPEMVEKYITNDVGPFIYKEPLQRIAKYIGIVPIFNNLQALENHLRMIYAPFGIKDDSHWQHMAEHGHRLVDGNKFTLAYDPNIAKTVFKESIDEITDLNLWEVWDKIKIPTLVIRGAESDILSKDTYQQMLEKSKTHGIEYPLIGHTPNLMEAHQINHIYEWLKK